MSNTTTVTLPGGFVYCFGGPEVPDELEARVASAPRRRVGRGFSATVDVTADDLRVLIDYAASVNDWRYSASSWDPDFVRTAPVVYERATDALLALTGSID